MKKSLIFLLLFIPLILLAQEGREVNYQVGGAVGATTINGETYTQIRLNPELSFWKFGIGLDIDLMINGDGDIREEDWDEWEDYMNKILYLRFAHRGDPFYALLGSFPSYTLANGLIINDYTNMLNYPDQKKVGGYLGFNTKVSGFGLEAFVADFNNMDVMATRAHFNPLQTTELAFLENLEIGVTYAYDKDQYLRFNDEDGDNVPDIFDDFPNDSNYAVDTDGDGFPDSIDLDADGDNLIDPVDEGWWHNLPEELQGQEPVLNERREYSDEEEVTIVGADYRLPLINQEYLQLYHYAEAAKIVDYGHGFIFPGFGARLAIFDIKLEGRRFEDEFLPGFFDYMYDNQRAFVNGDQIYTKTSLLKNVKASTGWYGSLTAEIANLLFLDVAYQDMYGQDVITGKSIWAGLRANTSMIPKINEATIVYSQKNKEYIDFKHFRNQNARIKGKLSYDLGGNTSLVGNYQELYSDNNNDGRIKGEEEISKTFSFSVEFLF